MFPAKISGSGHILLNVSFCNEGNETYPNFLDTDKTTTVETIWNVKFIFDET
jgi:hypothetical protein